MGAELAASVRTAPASEKGTPLCSRPLPLRCQIQEDTARDPHRSPVLPYKARPQSKCLGIMSLLNPRRFWELALSHCLLSWAGQRAPICLLYTTFSNSEYF